MPEKTIKTDGMMPLTWRWLLHLTYEDHYEVATGEAWCPHSAVTCAIAMVETFHDDEPHEQALCYAWNPSTHERVCIPIIPNPKHHAAAV